MPRQESIDQPIVNKDGIYVWFLVGAIFVTIVAIVLGYLELQEFYLK